MERILDKRESQNQLFSEVETSHRLPRAISVRRPIGNHNPGAVPVRRRPIGNHVPDTFPDGVLNRRITTHRPTTRRRTYKPKFPCPCPCGSGSYYICPAGCKNICAKCPCPCTFKNYNVCPSGCRPRE
ncbi:unnamed protein product, partial [Rotaria sp. Silwood2]